MISMSCELLIADAHSLNSPFSLGFGRLLLHHILAEHLKTLSSTIIVLMVMKASQILKHDAPHLVHDASEFGVVRFG